MSFPHLQWAARLPLQRSAKLVLVALSDFADSRGIAWPSIQQLALRAGISVRTAQRGLRELVAVAAIEVEARPRSTSVYRLNLPRDTTRAEQRRLPLFVVTGGRRALPPKGDNLTGGDTVAPLDGCQSVAGTVSSCHPTHTKNKPTDSPSGEHPQRSARRSRVPADWTPTWTGTAYAQQCGLDPVGEATRFRNHHAARGTLFADHGAAFRAWCDRAVEFRQRRGSQPAKAATPTEQWAARLRGETPEEAPGFDIDGAAL